MPTSRADPPPRPQEFFASTPLLQGLPPAALSELASAADRLFLPGGETLFHQNGSADRASLYRSGEHGATGEVKML